MWAWRTAPASSSTSSNLAVTSDASGTSYYFRYIGTSAAESGTGRRGNVDVFTDTGDHSALWFRPMYYMRLPEAIDQVAWGLHGGISAERRDEQVLAAVPVSRISNGQVFFCCILCFSPLYIESYPAPQRLKRQRGRPKHLSSSQPHLISSQHALSNSQPALSTSQKNPKTDYTYSESLTYRKRVTPERKVGSPNMSRKGLRGNIDYNKSSDFSDHSFTIDANSYATTHQNFRSTGLPMDALSDSESESPPICTRTRGSRSRSHSQRPNSNGSIITTVTKSSLDEESDEGEKGPLPSLRFRTGTPLTASRGGTPLVRRSTTPLFTSHKSETNTRQYTNTLLSTPEEEEEKSLYRKIVGVVGASSTSVVISSKWMFSYIVTSVILMATRSATYLSSSRSSSTTTADKLSSIEDSESATYLSSSRREEILDSTSGCVESVTTKVKRRPRLLFWIPLLLLLLLLAPGTYWWLFLAPATTDDVGETQSLGYLVTLPFIKLYDLSSWLALSVMPETDAATSWLSFAGVTHSTSDMIIETSRGLKQAAITSHDWIWSSWVWFIASSASSSGYGFLDTSFSLASWGFSSLWSLVMYLWTGLWSGLVYLLTSLWALLTSFTFTVAEFATGTAAVLTNTIKLITVPIIGYFTTSSVIEKTSPVITPSLEVSTPAPKVALENMVEEIVEKVLASSRLQDKLQLLINTHNKEEDVSALVRSVIEQEVSLVRAETAVLKKDVATISSDSVQILGLKEQQAALVKQLDMLAAAVDNTNENENKQQQFNDQLSGLREQINILSQQLQNLQDAHANLESEVSTCCKRASLTLADVERHVTTLLGDILGFSVGDNATIGESGEKPSSATASDLNAWLKSYFVAKHELEARLAALADSVEKATPVNIEDKEIHVYYLPKETMEQTTQMVMETVMDKIRGEIRQQHEQFSLQAKETLGKQIKAHVKEQVSEAVPIAVSSAVPDAVASQVSGVEISSALSDTVSAAVEEKISTTLPEVVADLPQLNMGEKMKGLSNKNIEKMEGNIENVSNSGTITANISLSQSNGKNSSFSVMTASGLNEKDVQRIVKEALIMYDADKTGMVDHALESAGGNIISTRCTEGYQVHMAEVSILGWPIYRYSINNPRTIIQPDVMPGQCWAFKGSQGYIVIQLAGPVRPTGFTMEHIPKTLSPSGSIDSAPREFTVWGLESENGEEIELGSYEFLHDGESLQYFSVKEGTIPDHMYFPIVELKIKSNHGNMKYTCLYRFRVHGVRYF
ncbi:unnamed protein product, partial [Meganyctiphanes norvegica]